jgi:uncharacterized protein YcsI (UPF0317 family)
MPSTRPPSAAEAARERIRAGRWRGSTAGAAPGFAQANLLVVERGWADEFRTFCALNPRPCPLLDVTIAGSPHPRRVAPEADLRTDLAGYRVYERGHMRPMTDLREVWRDDLVAFLLGCSFSFERALVASGIAMRHVDLRRTVPMYVTDRECAPAGRLHGQLVVSMRPIPAARVAEVRTICAGYPAAHGAPVHVGDPGAIGIADLAFPDFGEALPIGADEVPAFWACGVTPQVVLRASGCLWYASHEPGQMFITDRDESVATLDG